MALIFPKAIILRVNLVVFFFPWWAMGNEFFTRLGCGVEYLYGVAAVMVRDTAHSADDGETFTFCGLIVSNPQCGKTMAGTSR